MFCLIFLFGFTFILALDILAKIGIAQPCRYVWRWILELSIATSKVKKRVAAIPPSPDLVRRQQNKREVSGSDKAWYLPFSAPSRST